MKNKYRSWNEELKKFLYFEDGFYFVIECEYRKYFDYGYQIEDITYLFDWSSAEQYTGLKDMNNIDIYVGDIVSQVYKIKSIQRDAYIVYFGEWQQDGSGHEYASTPCFGFYLENINNRCTDIFESLLEVRNLKIISNIHEKEE